MQSTSWFVEKIEGVILASVGEFARDLEPLTLAPAESARRLTELQISQSYSLEQPESGSDRGGVGEEVMASSTVRSRISTPCFGRGN